MNFSVGPLARKDDHYGAAQILKRITEEDEEFYNIFSTFINIHLLDQVFETKTFILVGLPLLRKLNYNFLVKDI